MNFSISDDFSFKTGLSSVNSAVLLKEVLQARDLFVDAETKESECRWGLKNLKQELDLVNEALSSTSSHSGGKRYKSIQMLKTTLENSGEKLKELIEENFQLKLNAMDSFKVLRQQYYEASREVIEFPDSIDARDWLQKDTENRLLIIDVINDFLSNPEGDDTDDIDEENLEVVDEGYQASGDNIEQEEDFPSFNLHDDFTNKDYSQMLKSKLESTRLSFSRRSNLGSIGRQGAIEDEDFLEFNLDVDNTNREHSKMLKSKLEASKLSLSRKNSFQTLGQRAERENQIENFSDIDLDSNESKEIDEILDDDDVGDEYISQFDQINVMESTRIGDHGAVLFDSGDDEQEILSSHQENLHKLLDDQEVLRQIDSYRQILDKGILTITVFNEKLLTYGRQIDEALQKLSSIETEVTMTEMDYKAALLDFERNVSNLMDLGVNVLANEEQYRKTTTDLTKLWLGRADRQAHQIE